jgi:hypothetical protein
MAIKTTILAAIIMEITTTTIITTVITSKQTKSILRCHQILLNILIIRMQILI